MNGQSSIRKSLQEYSSLEKWVTTDKNRYKPRQIWFPLSDNISYWGEEFHDLMLHDRLRMEKFNEAIKVTVKYLLGTKHHGETLRILDIGTGYGILSYWAVKYAREYEPDVKIKVYAIDGNPVTAGE